MDARNKEAPGATGAGAGSTRNKELLDRIIESRGPQQESGKLRAALDDAKDHLGCSLADLTVLAVQNDPFRCDTPAGRRDAQWFFDALAELRPDGRPLHLRGYHYKLIGRTKPNGEIYENDEPTWAWVQNKPAKSARWLGYVPFEAISDERNQAPTVRTVKREPLDIYTRVGLDVLIPDAEELEPKVGVAGFQGEQPFRLVLFGEKSSLGEVLEPIAERYGFDLYLMTGEISDTHIARMARDADEDGRPLKVFTLCDCDPSGWQMSISIGRKLQALRALLYPGLRFEVYRVGLLPSQVEEYGLPCTPLKDSERRAGKWQEAMGVEQTEVDALLALRPDLLEDLVEEAIAPFYDFTLESRVWEARSEWLDAAQQLLNESTTDLDAIRNEAAEKLEELKEEIDALNDKLRLSTPDLDFPPVAVPTARVTGAPARPPLVTTSEDFARQCSRLIASKQYKDGGRS